MVQRGQIPISFYAAFRPLFSVDFAVVCDVPIDEASAFMPRTNSSVNMSARFSADRKTFYFSWDPPLPWQKSIWVLVFSKQEIRDPHPVHLWCSLAAAGLDGGILSAMAILRQLTSN